MWNCKNCGTLNEDRASYCDKCGTPKKDLSKNAPGAKKGLLQRPVLLYFLVGLLLYFICAVIYWIVLGGLSAEADIYGLLAIVLMPFIACGVMFLLLVVSFLGAELWFIWITYILLSGCQFALFLQSGGGSFSEVMGLVWLLYFIYLIGIALLIYRRRRKMKRRK